MTDNTLIPANNYLTFDEEIKALIPIGEQHIEVNRVKFLQQLKSLPIPTDPDLQTIHRDLAYGLFRAKTEMVTIYKWQYDKMLELLPPTPSSTPNLPPTNGTPTPTIVTTNETTGATP